MWGRAGPLTPRVSSAGAPGDDLHAGQGLSLIHIFASSGILLPPAAAAVLMSLSTIVVALNAQLLRRIDLDPAHLAPTSPKEEHTTPTPASTAVH